MADKIKSELFYGDIPERLILEQDIAIDTETMGLKINRDRLCVLQFSFGDNKAYLVKFDGGDYSAPNLRKLLSLPNTQKIFHYARFDISIIKNNLEVDLKNIFCTKIASRLTRTYTDYHGLKDICRELLNISISKQQQSSYWGAEKLTNDQISYAASDVIYLHKLREIFISMLKLEKRYELANEVFSFLSTRSKLDIDSFEYDIFAH